MNSGDVVLVLSGSCWGACFLLFLAQLVGTQIHQLSPWFFVGACVFHVVLLFALPRLARLLCRDSENRNRPWYDNTLAFHERKAPLYVLMGGGLSVAEFLVLLSPFVFIIHRVLAHQDEDAHRLSKDMMLVLALLDVGGHVVLFLMEYFRSFHGLFVSILAGVVCTSYKGFGHDDRHVFKAMIIVLSVVMVLLCGTFVSIQDDNARDHLASQDQAAAIPIP